MARGCTEMSDQSNDLKDLKLTALIAGWAVGPRRVPMEDMSDLWVSRWLSRMKNGVVMTGFTVLRLRAGLCLINLRALIHLVIAARLARMRAHDDWKENPQALGPF